MSTHRSNKEDEQQRAAVETHEENESAVNMSLDDDDCNISEAVAAADTNTGTTTSSEQNLDGTAAATPIASPPALLFKNRFSQWRKQAAQTVSASSMNTISTQTAALFRRTNSAGSNSQTVNSGKASAAAVPLQSATLSPAAKSSARSSSSRDEDEDNKNNSSEDDDVSDCGSREDDSQYGETSSSVVTGGSSLYTDSYVSESTSTRTTALQWAAASVVGSVQQNFRGRYNLNTGKGTHDSHTQATPPRNNTTADPAASSQQQQSQTSRLLSSPLVASHWQNVVGQLTAPCQYVMLLGRGMLGVNLKQAYLKQQGVYVDFLVPHGSAAKSNVIWPGDSLLQVGDVSVETQNIWTVPQIIAQAPRPVHLVLSTAGTQIKSLTAQQHQNWTFVDVCVALLHVYVVRNEQQEEKNATDEKNKTSDKKLVRRNENSDSDEDDDANNSVDGQVGQNSDDDDEKDADVELVAPTSFDNEDDNDSNSRSGLSPNESGLSHHTPEHPLQLPLNISLQDSVHDFVSPQPPPASICEALSTHLLKRGNEHKFSFSTLTQATATHEDLRHAMRNALLLCVMDGRRFPFLAKHVSNTDKNGDNGDESNNNAMLMLLLELVNFCDVWPVTPRHRQYDMANKIARKYFLPTQLSKHEWVPPLFDFHTVVSDTSLRQLEAQLVESLSKHQQEQQHQLPPDLFIDFQRAVADELARRPFLSFLVSDECARMRAYLRNTAPFINVSLESVRSNRNYWLYVMAYLLSLTDKDSFGETELAVDGTAVRMDDAATGLAAALFLNDRVLPILRKASATGNEKEDPGTVRKILEQLWEIYLAPGVGALSHRNKDMEVHLTAVHRALQELVTVSATSAETEENGEIVVSKALVASLQALADELFHEYATTLHSKFRMHKFHEWMCDEMSRAAEEEKKKDETHTLPIHSQLPTRLPDYCIKRLLRKTEWPVGVTPHKPSHDAPTKSLPDKTTATKTCHVNAHCAVVFGTVVGLELLNKDACPGLEDPTIRRYACQSLYPGGDDNILQPDEIIPTLESYAVVPQARPKPFQDYSGCTVLDGWDVSLVNFVIPRADMSSEDGDAAMYGVSLTLRQSSRPPLSQSPPDAETSSYVQSVNNYISENETFRTRLKERSWIDRVQNEIREEASSLPVIGIILASRRNTISAMRETLSDFLSVFARNSRELPSLVNLLGNLAHQDIDPDALSRLLLPFVEKTSKPWLDRPIDAQKQVFLQMAGQQIIQSLPPIPLALLFTTVLLEQKIVLSSSRRGILASASVALSEMLKPLSWCHLLVPCVPAGLAVDLLQYPAPYILGMPAEDEGIVELIQELPSDVTLVDLDVGRVILAPSFANDSELGRGTQKNADTARALRSQVLFLAQSLGSAFGPKLDPSMWLCDRIDTHTQSTISAFDELCTVCKDFITELLDGVPACCYWFDEELSSEPRTKNEPTILFDEDRFFHIKNVREQNGYEALFPDGRTQQSQRLALSLENFDLLLELFLRCQSMNAYIGTRKPDEMAFASI